RRRTLKNSPTTKTWKGWAASVGAQLPNAGAEQSGAGRIEGGARQLEEGAVERLAAIAGPQGPDFRADRFGTDRRAEKPLEKAHAATTARRQDRTVVGMSSFRQTSRPHHPGHRRSISWYDNAQPSDWAPTLHRLYRRACRPRRDAP